MARVKISEYRAKKILLGDSYKGVQLKDGSAIPKGKWVAKVDQGVKKRFKQGLLVVNASGDEIRESVDSWKKKGFSQFLLEPYVPHEKKDEQYVSLERVRDGIRMLHSKNGGIDIEENPEAVQQYLLRYSKDVPIAAKEAGLPPEFLADVYKKFDENFFSFLEINPLVVRDGAVSVLDAAVLVDSAAEFFAAGSWTHDDIIQRRSKHEVEEHIEALAATTPASLKLSVINPNGALFFLLSGGGGSIAIADEAQIHGVGNLIANYGEYSGGPSREETYLYAKEVLALIFASKAEKKALVVAGGVANFTDVRQTFLGIIDAPHEGAEKLRAAKVSVFVRRGGPHEAAGLSLMKEFLEREKLLGTVAGSEAIMTKAIVDAIQYVAV